MAIASFEDLCAGVCELVGMPVPRLDTRIDGVRAFHFDVRDVKVNVIHAVARSPDHVFVLFEMGPLPDGDAAALRAMKTLLDSNFPSLRHGAPSFGLNPASGAAVMQLEMPLFDATPIGLLDLLDGGVDRTLRWRGMQAADFPHAPHPGAAPAVWPGQYS